MRTRAILVWTQYKGDLPRLHKKEYSGGAWSGARLLTGRLLTSGNAGGAAAFLAMDNHDNAIVVSAIRSGEPKNYRIYKNELRNGHWTYPADLSDCISFGEFPANFSDLAMDNNGNAIIVWEQSGNGPGPIFMAEYR